ncbi:hypothetical protein BDB00DRAFT_917795, partial [Zychaea mexicana]|uniref:uncharacterized protein n=1 Tax=Zychaea mexicana TaxID=64656 RepID=UPI0022FEA28A
ERLVYQGRFGTSLPELSTTPRGSPFSLLQVAGQVLPVQDVLLWGRTCSSLMDKTHVTGTATAPRTENLINLLSGRHPPPGIYEGTGTTTRLASQGSSYPTGFQPQSHEVLLATDTSTNISQLTNQHQDDGASAPTDQVAPGAQGYVSTSLP